MASAWERKRQNSDVEKPVAFLPRLLANVSPKSNIDSQVVHGVLLLVDISGFTALTEKFIQRSSTDRGADELAQILNSYLCDILEEMLIFGGDILKFAGDAVLVLWRTRAQELAKTIRLVLQCSQQIQKKYGTRDTRVGQKLRLKIGISAGFMDFMIFGDRRWRYFVICGQALNEVREAEGLANAGEVILSATSWELCEQHRLGTEHVAGKGAVKVTDMDEMSSSERQDALHKLLQRPRSHHFVGEGAMGPALLLPNDPNSDAVLRQFIPEAALRKLDDSVPLDFFPELRPVTSLFIRLHLCADVSKRDLYVLLCNASTMMLDIISPHKGKIHKVTLFDKGCTFLCVFGLPGEKQPYESLLALQSAIQIFNSCSRVLRKIQAVSIAVTSGTVFCGVIGHPVRHEYTVIGQKVNLAARMMMHYPGLVSCDARTYAASRLPPYFFKELPEQKMKGISNPGSVYQYLGINEEIVFGMGLTKTSSEYRSLLGRDKEIELFCRCLKAYGESGQRHILAFEGTTVSGKSRLLAELAYLGQAAGHRVVAVELLETNVRNPFSAIRILMDRALDLQDCESCSAREHVLQTKLRGTIEESSYSLLNGLFLVGFPDSDTVCEMHETQRKTETRSTWTKVLEKVVGGEFGIFIIDNAHFIDPASWSIMSSVFQNASLFMVISLAPGYTGTESFFRAIADNTTSQNITCVHLDELKPSAVVQKVCQDLGVVSIPRELVRFLIQRSSGIPYHCEELLRCLCRNNVLLLHSQKWGEKAEDNWESLIASALKDSSLAATSSSSAGKDGRVCVIRADMNLENTVLPTTLKEIALAQLDRIESLEQTALKFAAVIGPVFTTQLLSHILPAGIRHNMNCLLNRLVHNNILKWLKKPEVPQDAQDATKGPATAPQAESGVERPSRSQTMALPSDVLAFCVPLLREAAYELWPERQRVALHRKCAAFLEQHAHKCESCSQGDFVAFHRFTVTGTQGRGSSQDSADKGDSRSWEALVLAGEQMTRDRTQAFLEGDFGRTGGKHKGACSCECKAIVEVVLVPLVRHYKAMGDTARAFYYLLECVAAYLHVSNSYMALMKLNEAEVLRKSAEKKAIARFEDATFFSLKGEVCCQWGRMKLSEKMTREALRLLKRQFPRTSVGAFVKSKVEKFLGAAYVPKRASSLPEEARRKRQAWLLRQSCCLSLLEHLCSQEGTSSARRFSRLAARMKANTDRAAHSYQAGDFCHA
ncbi:adenylate cyclase type 10-like [Nyctibius grandis]|uniref:adenylate cyclase type 10-like n=1 Tax=Nyctibius grandis TaxID=48427 RepID=UPI0035BBF4A8